MPTRLPALNLTGLHGSKLLVASVDEWLDRVRAVTGAADGGDAFVAAGAKWLALAGGSIGGASSHAGRMLWRMWARRILANGEKACVVRGADFEVALAAYGPDAVVPVRPQSWAPALRGLGALMFSASESCSPESAEHHAALIEGACTMLDAEIAAHGRNEAEYTARVASIVGFLFDAVTRQRLLPYAVTGREATDGRRRGGPRAAEARQKTRGLFGWRKEACRLDSMMDDDLSKKQRASLIASRLKGKLSWRTVYDALPARRSRKSSR